MIISDKRGKNNIQEKQEKQIASLGVYVKIYGYLGKIPWWDFKRTGAIQKQSQDILFFSSLKAFTSEDVFAGSLHQMPDKYRIILCHRKDTNG